MTAPSLLPSLSKRHEEIEDITTCWNGMGLI